MSEGKPVFRHELKYLMTRPEAALVRARLAGLMERDPHAGETGSYTIRSLYFDDYYDSALKEKEAGIYARKKYRIRIYNGSDAFIAFERKTKNDAYIHKESVQISRAECDRILAGEYGFLEKRREGFCRELYFELTARLLRPRVIVDYEREPFLCRAGNVRITFDSLVRGSGSTELFDPDLPVRAVLPPEKLIMEVKYDSFLPEYLRRAVVPGRAEYSAVSKFVLCCEVCPKKEAQFGWQAAMPLHALCLDDRQRPAGFYAGSHGS